MITQTFFGEIVGDVEHTIVQCCPVDACSLHDHCLVHSSLVTHPDYTGSMSLEPLGLWCSNEAINQPYTPWSKPW